MKYFFYFKHAYLFIFVSLQLKIMKKKTLDVNKINKKNLNDQLNYIFYIKQLSF